VRKAVLAVTGAGKSYAGNPALAGVDLELAGSQVHALVGENGAGKSTLVKIISGGLAADAGSLALEGRPFRPRSPADAQRRGVVAVHQELSLSPYLPVYQNVLLGRREGSGPFLNPGLLRRLAGELQRRYGTSIDPESWVSDLPLEEQQVVEILKALAFDPRVLILDEPTSALGAENTRWLLDLIRELKARGRAILFISHRLPEIMELADTITVLKDGRKVATVERAGTDADEVVRMMVGRELSDIFPPKPDRASLEAKPVLLRVRGLVAERVRRAELEVRAGEVVGLAGLEGQGQHELLLALFGINPVLAGEIEISGRKVSPRSPARAIAAGISLVPVDRRTEGIILPLSVAHNIAMATLDRRQRLGWVDRVAEQRLAADMIGRLAIRTRSPSTPVGDLSGGNQQKVALGKWLAAEPRLLLLDDPTRGVDIQTRRDIYHRIRRLAAQGVGVLLSSTDTIELVGTCDRVLVMYEGRIVSALEGSAITEQNIVSAAVGLAGGESGGALRPAG
jgi:ribose transport system ATP-binding protein